MVRHRVDALGGFASPVSRGRRLGSLADILGDWAITRLIVGSCALPLRETAATLWGYGRGVRVAVVPRVDLIEVAAYPVR